MLAGLGQADDGAHGVTRPTLSPFRTRIRRSHFALRTPHSAFSTRHSAFPVPRAALGFQGTTFVAGSLHAPSFAFFGARARTRNQTF